MTRTLLTLKEAAEELHTSEGKFRYWRYLGTGPRSFKIGRRVMYASDDLEAWLAQQYADGNRSSLHQG